MAKGFRSREEQEQHERSKSKKPSDFDRLMTRLVSIQTSLDRIDKNTETNHPSQSDEIGLRISAVHGRGYTMARNIDRGSVNLLDTQGEVLSIAAKNAAGDVQGNPATDYSWASADQANALISEQMPAGPNARELTPYERWVGTPGEANASVVITVTHTPSGNTETLTLVIASTNPGEIGLSAGDAILEP